MCCTTSAGSGLPPARCVISASTCGRSRRLRVMRRHMRARRPGRRKLRAKGQHVQHRHRGRLLQHQAQHLQRGGVGPVQVFPRHQHRLPLGFLQHPGHQRIEGLLLLLLGGQASGRHSARPAAPRAGPRTAAPPRRAAGDRGAGPVPAWRASWRAYPRAARPAPAPRG